MTRVTHRRQPDIQYRDQVGSRCVLPNALAVDCYGGEIYPGPGEYDGDIRNRTNDRVCIRGSNETLTIAQNESVSVKAPGSLYIESGMHRVDQENEYRRLGNADGTEPVSGNGRWQFDIGGAGLRLRGGPESAEGAILDLAELKRLGQRESKEANQGRDH